MLGKLLKYDLKWSLKLICIFLGIGLFLAILGRVLELCPDSMFFAILIGIIKGASLSLTITGVFNAVIRSWVRFILNCYKDESYLTNTIPVKRSTILYSLMRARRSLKKNIIFLQFPRALCLMKPVVLKTNL